MISPFYKDFLFRNLANPERGKEAYKLLDSIFSSTSNIPIISYVTLAASFCPYYSTLQQKYGAMSFRNLKTIEIGNKVHELLSLSSIKLFETSRPSINENLILDNINKAKEELEKIHRVAGDKNFTVDKEVKEIAKTLLKGLINVSRQLKGQGKISDYSFFPIVEQNFHDFDYKLYGIPDLILEREDKEFAVVVEWKTHSINDEGYPDETDKAQVIAYSILEARRLGINDYDSIFEAISGLSINEIESLDGNVNEYEILRESLGRVKVLPVVIGKKGGHPPHPSFYEKTDKKGDVINRFRRMLDLYKRVIVGAEYLTLQLTKIYKLQNYSIDEIKEIFKSKSGKPIYYLMPDGLKKGFCPNCLLRDPCYYYFSHGNKSNLDEKERVERLEILDKREENLLHHKVIDMVLTRDEIEKLRKDPDKCYVYKVILDKNRVEEESGKDPINIIKVYRRGKELLTFKFDIFKGIVENPSAEANIVLYRKARSEEVKGKGGLLKSSTVALIDMSKENVIPTLSISIYISISSDNYKLNKNRENMYVVVPVNPSFYLSFKRFKYYVKYYQEKKKDIAILAYESAYDLTSLENKGVFTTYGLLRKVDSNDDFKGSMLWNLKRYLGE